jgi:hypothetical protein
MLIDSFPQTTFYRGKPTSGSLQTLYTVGASKTAWILHVAQSNEHASTTRQSRVYLNDFLCIWNSITARSAASRRRCYVLPEGQTLKVNHEGDITYSITGVLFDSSDMPYPLPITFYRGKPGTSEATVYTVPANKVAVIKTISLHYDGTAKYCIVKLNDVMVFPQKGITAEFWGCSEVLTAGQTIKLQGEHADVVADLSGILYDV